MPYQAFEIKEISKRDFSSYLCEHECAIILKVWRSKWLLDICGNQKMSPQALIQVLQLNRMIKVMSQVTAFAETRGWTSEKGTGTIQRNVENAEYKVSDNNTGWGAFRRSFCLFKALWAEVFAGQLNVCVLNSHSGFSKGALHKPFKQPKCVTIYWELHWKHK